MSWWKLAQSRNPLQDLQDYVSIGHTPSRTCQHLLWVWKNGQLATHPVSGTGIRTTFHTHIWPEAEQLFRGRYDCTQNKISVWFPRNTYTSTIPTILRKSLESKFKTTDIFAVTF